MGLGRRSGARMRPEPPGPAARDPPAVRNSPIEGTERPRKSATARVQPPIWRASIPASASSAREVSPSG